jgi:hypothetical protein
LLVGVDHDTEKARVGVNDVALVSLSEVVEHGGLAQVRQLSAILNTIELGRVHLVDEGFLELELVSLVGADSGDSTRSAKDLGGDETSLLVRSPGHLLVSEARDLEARVSGVLEELVIVRLLGLLSGASESHVG